MNREISVLDKILEICEVDSEQEAIMRISLMMDFFKCDQSLEKSLEKRMNLVASFIKDTAVDEEFFCKLAKISMFIKQTVLLENQKK